MNNEALLTQAKVLIAGRAKVFRRSMQSLLPVLADWSVQEHPMRTHCLAL